MISEKTKMDLIMFLMQTSFPRVLTEKNEKKRKKKVIHRLAARLFLDSKKQ